MSTGPARKLSEADLSAYVDGELTLREREAVEALAARRPDVRARLEELEAVAAAVRGLPIEPAPRDFAYSVMMQASRPHALRAAAAKWMARTRLWGGLAAAAAFTFAVGWGWGRWGAPAPQDFSSTPLAARPTGSTSEHGGVATRSNAVEPLEAIDGARLAMAPPVTPPEAASAGPTAGTGTPPGTPLPTPSGSAKTAEPAPRGPSSERFTAAGADDSPWPDEPSGAAGASCRLDIVAHDDIELASILAVVRDAMPQESARDRSDVRYATSADGSLEVRFTTGSDRLLPMLDSFAHLTPEDVRVALNLPGDELHLLRPLRGVDTRVVERPVKPRSPSDRETRAASSIFAIQKNIAESPETAAAEDPPAPPAANARPHPPAAPALASEKDRRLEAAPPRRSPTGLRNPHDWEQEDAEMAALLAEIFATPDATAAAVPGPGPSRPTGPPAESPPAPPAERPRPQPPQSQPSEIARGESSGLTASGDTVRVEVHISLPG